MGMRWGWECDGDGDAMGLGMHWGCIGDGNAIGIRCGRDRVAMGTSKCDGWGLSSQKNDIDLLIEPKEEVIDLLGLGLE
eukprot:421864-Amorphochlora_amoeboformis.AAC.1